MVTGAESFGTSSPAFPFLVSPLLILVMMMALWATPSLADPSNDAITEAFIEDDPFRTRLDPLSDLLILPSEMYAFAPESTDEALAIAVTLGNDPALERRNPFRKRSTDLFRTQRWVTVGQRDMLVRLRVRANTRRAMAVEVKF